MNNTMKAAQSQFAQLLTAGPAPDELAVTALLRPLRGQPPRLDIYRHAWAARLTDALRSNFPVHHQVLGDDDFQALCLAFVAHHPPRQPSIRWLGEHLEAFLRQCPEHLAHPSLLDLVRMEWALGCSFDAADAPALAFQDLAALPAEAWAGLRFQAHPSVQLLALDWAVEPLWRQLTLYPGSEVAPPEPLTHLLVVWRQGQDSRWLTLDPVQAGCLQAALVKQQDFGQLCELAGQVTPNESDGDPATAMALALRSWVDAGWLGSFTLPTQPAPA